MVFAKLHQIYFMFTNRHSEILGQLTTDMSQQWFLAPESNSFFLRSSARTVPVYKSSSRCLCRFMFVCLSACLSVSFTPPWFLCFTFGSLLVILVSRLLPVLVQSFEKLLEVKDCVEEEFRWEIRPRPFCFTINWPTITLLCDKKVNSAARVNHFH